MVRARVSGKVMCFGYFMASSLISMIPFSYLLITRRLSSEFYYSHVILKFFKFTQFSFTLLSNRSYVIWVHDPDFFLPSINPDLIPQTHIRIEDKPTVIWVYLRPVYYETLSKSGEIKKETRLEVNWNQLI